MKENIANKVSKLKEERTKVEDISQDLSKKVFEKLQKYKEKLVLTVAQTKMIEEIRQFYRFSQADKISHINRTSFYQ